MALGVLQVVYDFFIFGLALLTIFKAFRWDVIALAFAFGMWLRWGLEPRKKHEVQDVYLTQATKSGLRFGDDVCPVDVWCQPGLAYKDLIRCNIIYIFLVSKRLCFLMAVS